MKPVAFQYRKVTSAWAIYLMQIVFSYRLGDLHMLLLCTCVLTSRHTWPRVRRVYWPTTFRQWGSWFLLDRNVFRDSLSYGVPSIVPCILLLCRSIFSYTVPWGETVFCFFMSSGSLTPHFRILLVQGGIMFACPGFRVEIFSCMVCRFWRSLSRCDCVRHCVFSPVLINTACAW